MKSCRYAPAASIIFLSTIRKGKNNASYFSDHVHPNITTTYPSSNGFFQHAMWRIKSLLKLVSWAWQGLQWPSQSSDRTVMKCGRFRAWKCICNLIYNNHVNMKQNQKSFQNGVEVMPQISRTITRGKGRHYSVQCLIIHRHCVFYCSLNFFFMGIFIS